MSADVYMWFPEEATKETNVIKLPNWNEIKRGYDIAINLEDNIAISTEFINESANQLSQLHPNTIHIYSPNNKIENHQVLINTLKSRGFPIFIK